MKLTDEQKRLIDDAIDDAYDLGYAHAQNAHGDQRRVDEGTAALVHKLIDALEGIVRGGGT